MKNFHAIPWVICFLFFQNITIHSQTSLTGKISDKETGEDMIAANIEVLKNGVLIQGETTDIDGNYSLRIDPGTYDLKVTYTGYVGHLVTGVIANAGQNKKVDVQLDTGGAMLEDLMTLEYKVPLVKKHKTSSCCGSTSEQIRNLPTRNINAVVAATSSQAYITGKVTEAETGEELIGANIVITKNGVSVREFSTDINGEYRIGIEAGTYDLEVNYVGFENQRIKDIVVKSGKVKRIDVQLKAGAVLDEVVVTGLAIRKEKKSLGYAISTISSEDIRSVLTRDVSTIAATTAGASSSDDGGDISIKGSRSSATDYYIDGVRIKGKEMIKDSKVSIIENEMEEESLATDSRILISNNKFFETTDYILRDKIELKNNFPMVELDPAKVIVFKKHIITPPKVGQLTAAEWRDADHWKVWKTQQKDKDYKQAKSDWKFYLTNRYTVLVENKKGQPLANIEVELVNAKKMFFGELGLITRGKQIYGQVFLIGEKMLRI